MTRLYLPLFLGFVGRTISETRFRVKKPGGVDAERFLQGRLCSNRGALMYTSAPISGLPEIGSMSTQVG
jgi:hypothetical protein